ncbi:hypothetical protein COOONC_19254 [Cooperia oncophora]
MLAASTKVLALFWQRHFGAVVEGRVTWGGFRRADFYHILQVLATPLKKRNSGSNSKSRNPSGEKADQNLDCLSAGEVWVTSEVRTDFNREMWWVATENSILMYCPLRHCRELRYFNFAVMSGLDKPALRRLHSTWERVSG